MDHHPLPPFDPWLWWQACQQTWMASVDPLGMGRRLRQIRLDRLLHLARRDSPLYARRAGHARVLADFEPIGRRELMLHFDTWSTDRRVTRQGADAVIAAPAAWSDAWLDRYLLWTSSGTLGEPGIFVQDAASLAAFDAIDALRLRGAALAQPGLGLWGMGRRFVFVGALGGPYAGHVSLQRLHRLAPPPWGPQVHLISVLEPLQQIAERLQRLQPDVLITYPSCASALATWQAEGVLDLRLDELWLGGEQLSLAQRQRLKDVYGCPLRNNYGASEFYSMACECSQGQLHLNDDWVILEGIDAQGQAAPPDEFSCTTLLTNLANQVQPLLRYELTDRVRFVPEPCRCGCALPVIEVQGRSDDVLTLAAAGGGTVQLLPLAVEAAIEEAADVTYFQLLRRPPGVLELRLRPDGGDQRSAFLRCQHALQAFLNLQGALPLDIVQGDAEPLQQRSSGKLRRVIDLGSKA